MAIRVAHWNVWNQEKAANVLSGIRVLDADIYCLHELSANTIHNPNVELAWFLRKAAGLYCHFPAARCFYDRPTGIEQHGSAILSRLPFAWSTSLQLKELKDPSNPYDENPRIYLEADLELPQGTLTIATAHLSFTPGFRADEIKRPETEKLAAILRQRTKKSEWLLFTTDSNSLPGSPTMDLIGQILEDCGPPPDQATWPREPQEFPDGFKSDALRYRIDYIFGTPDLKARAATRIIKLPYSDHLAVVCELEI